MKRIGEYAAYMMPANLVRRPWLWIVTVVATAVLLIVVLLPVGSPSTIDRPLGDFLQAALAGRVESVEVEGSEIRWRLIGDDQTFETRVGDGVSVRQLLRDAGVELEDFPPIEIVEP